MALPPTANGTVSQYLEHKHNGDLADMTKTFFWHCPYLIITMTPLLPFISNIWLWCESSGYPAGAEEFNFAQWRYSNQWSNREVLLLLVENYTQYPGLTGWNTPVWANFWRLLRKQILSENSIYQNCHSERFSKKASIVSQEIFANQDFDHYDCNLW